MRAKLNANVAIQVLPAVQGDEEVVRVVDAVIDYIKSTGVEYYVGPCETAMEGDYDNLVFISGFVVNILLSVFFCYAGIKMDIDFYLIVILVLGMRIFNNLAIIRRLYLKK